MYRHKPRDLTVRQLIEELQAFEKEFGDVEVVVPGDNGWEPFGYSCATHVRLVNAVPRTRPDYRDSYGPKDAERAVTKVLIA